MSAAASPDRLSVHAAAAEVPDRIALVDDAGSLTWRALAAAVDDAAPWAADLAPGDRVAVTPVPDRAGVLTLLALLERPVSLVLLHPRWTERERADALARTRPRYVLEGAEPTATPARGGGPGWGHPQPPELVVFTSGSSGRPKGVRLSRRALIAAADAHAAALPWRDDDRWLLAMPLAHVGGLSVLTRVLAARASIAIGPARFDPDTLGEAAGRLETTLLSLVPTMLERLLAAGCAPPPTLRAALLGGAACPPALLARGRAAGWPLLPTYGLSESCAQVCTQRLGDERPTGVGPPLPGIALRVVDGEILVGGPTLMNGFIDDTDAVEDGWYRTGDLGELDDEGHLHVRGRADRRIVTGGENVDPLEVEAALLEHPAVRSACVVGVEDPRWGQRVAAAVVTEARDEATLRAHLAARLAGFKHPRSWVFVDALPITPSGKPDPAAVRRLFH